MVLLTFALGAALILANTAIHGAAMVFLMERIRTHHMLERAQRSRITRVTFVSATLLVLLAATLVEAALWGCTYLAVGALTGFEPALYFSMVTYTGLGYGDMVLPPGSFRLLSSLEAANGILMLGWSTAVTLAVMQRVYGTRGARAHPAGEES